MGNGNAAGSNSSNNNSKKDYKVIRTYERLGMSDQQIYYWIYSYCLDLTRLRHLGFPLDSELHPGKAVIYVDPDIGMRSCTKGGGDLNSLEFCVDDFSSADVNPESISSTVSTSHLAQIPIITNLVSKTKTYERPDRDDAETL